MLTNSLNLRLREDTREELETLSDDCKGKVAPSILIRYALYQFMNEYKGSTYEEKVFIRDNVKAMVRSMDTIFIGNADVDVDEYKDQMKMEFGEE